MRPFFISSICLALVISAVNAQTTPPQITPPPVPAIASEPSDEPKIPLETLIQRALDSSPRLQIARENLEAARNTQRATRALASPTLQMVPGFSGSREARDEEIILAQPLDIFGLRRARAQVGAAEVRRAEADSRLISRSLIIEVKTAAAQLFAAQEKQNIEQIQVEVAQLFRDAAAKRAALGDVPAVQVQRADLELLRAQNDLAKARSSRLTHRAALNFLIGAAPDEPLRVVLPLSAVDTDFLRAGTVATPSSEPFAQLEQNQPLTPATSATNGGELVVRDSNVVTRPDIASAQASLEMRQAQARAIGRQSLPTVELQARRSSFFGRDGSTALRAVVTVPLFDFGAIKGQRRAAEASARAQAATVDLLNKQAAAQAENARIQLAVRRETAARYREQLLPLTLDLLRKTQIGYTQGASTYLEVLEAQRTLRQIQSEYLQALVGIQSGETALDAALNGGTTPPENLNFSSREATFNESQ